MRLVSRFRSAVLALLGIGALGTALAVYQPEAVGALSFFQPAPATNVRVNAPDPVSEGCTTTVDPDYTSVSNAVTAASSGDTICLNAGTETWTSGVTVPAGLGITIRGSGTPNTSAATFGASASCTATTITVTGATAFRATPTYGTATMRVSCLQLTYGSGASIGFSVLGTCTASGCPDLRLDNLTFTNWANHAANGISYGINVAGNVFGVVDHNTVTGVASNYLQLFQLSHASYLGVGHWGDKAWAMPEDYGTNQFLFFENNSIGAAGLSEHEGSAGALADAGGGRIVGRFNQFVNMDQVNFSMGWHGTESFGRPRGFRTFEYYQNTHDCAAGGKCTVMVAARSGTGLAWGNASTGTNSVTSLIDLSNYRQLQNIGGWGACDGSSPWDTNDGTVYYSDTIASVSGSNPYTITVSGSPGWTTNQWVNAAPYSVHDVTIDNGSDITANGSNTLTVSAWTSIPYAAGDSIQILRATVCLDQAGGRGAGILYNDTNPATPEDPANQALSPTYAWLNTFSATPTWVIGTWPNHPRVIRNREFYNENVNQAAQSSATSPFNGSTTIGVGHGTIANRPATCTTGVAYWSTDEGEWNSTNGATADGRLYLCTSTNTWTLSYTPYTYPHPLVQ